MPLPQQILKVLDMSPARTGSAVKPILEKLQETQCFQDISERSINRPQDSHTQEVFYSEKKSPHDKKQLLDYSKPICRLSEFNS
jgi:hypothetical protein